MSAVEICTSFNPYFKDNCKLGALCPYIHLDTRNYVMFCQKVSVLNPPNQPAISAFTAAKNHWNKGQLKHSLYILRQLLNFYPLNEEYHTLIVKCYEKLGHYHHASQHHRRLIAMAPYNPIYHVNYGMFLYRRKRQNSTAKCHFVKALELSKSRNSGIAKVHGCFAKFIHETERDTKQAMYHCKISLQHGDDARTHYNYAKLLHDVGDLEKADHHYKKSLYRKDRDCNLKIWHHFNYALFLKQCKKYKGAKEQMLICLGLRNYHVILYEYGLLLCECNNFDEGIQYLDKARQLKPNRKSYQKAYNRFKSERDVLQLFNDHERKGIIGQNTKKTEDDTGNEEDTKQEVEEIGTKLIDSGSNEILSLSSDKSYRCNVCN